MTSWIDGPLLGFDTETTGTDVASDRIVTVALVFSAGPGRDLEVISTWLIDPGVPIPDGAARVHGISSEYAREHGMDPGQALDEAAALLVDALEQDTPIVAFNASFDLHIIENELRRNSLPTLADRLGREVAPVIDPLVLDRAMARYRKGPRKLMNLMEVYSVAPQENLHSADVDVSATLDVLRAMAVKYPELGSTALGELHQYQITARREWAENFNRWLQSKGRVPDADPSWPL